MGYGQRPQSCDQVISSPFFRKAGPSVLASGGPALLYIRHILKQKRSKFHHGPSETDRRILHHNNSDVD